MEDKKLTASMEDYIKEIYSLGGNEVAVRVTDISRVLGISKPSVNKAINQLRDMGYLVHEHYGGVQLTQEGVAVAERLLDAYKVSYKFLTNVLNVSDETAMTEAHMMEHILSRGTQKKLKKFMKKKKKG